GAITSYDSPARYLPSARTQQARQARLPEPHALRRELDAALADSPFRRSAFEPFAADVEAARTAEPLRPADLEGTPLATRVDGLLLQRADGATALVALGGLTQPQAVATTARANGAQLLDLKQASESLVAAYRDRVLLALAGAAVLLVLTVLLALRSRRRALLVLAPMALATLVILAVLRGLGVELNLFHLVSLVLAAGLGLDYALFFEHAGDARDEQLRTLHAVIVCSITTLLVFSLLALSSIPVLRAIGSTVAIGVAANFVLALLVARHPAAARTSAAPRPAPRSSRGCRTPARCACGTRCWTGATTACCSRRTAIAIPRIRCATTATCTPCTCASTARRRWRCTAACAHARPAARRAPACWWHCAASRSRRRASTTCRMRCAARPRWWRRTPAAASMGSASCIAATASQAGARR